MRGAERSTAADADIDTAGHDARSDAATSNAASSNDASVAAASAPHGAGTDLLSTAVRAAGYAIAQRDFALPLDVALAQSALLELEGALRAPAQAAQVLRTAAWTPLARPLLDLVRRQVLHAADAAGDSEGYAESHTWLLAVECVQDALQSDDLHQVADQLSGGGALALLVEVAHDMRSPLGSILFLVDRVRSGLSGPVSDAASRQLGLVYSAAFGLSAMSSDLMEFSRGGGRLVGSSAEEFSMADVFRRVRELMQPVAEEKGLMLVIDTPSRDVRRGYPAALVRVLLNLATTACKFTSQGEVAIRAVVLSGDAVRFEVQDTGRGVPPEVAERLYETFRPRTGSGASSGAFAFSSAGLGLAICRKLTAAMGGSLQMQTVSGEGTRFHFTLALPLG